MAPSCAPTQLGLALSLLAAAAVSGGVLGHAADDYHMKHAMQIAEPLDASMPQPFTRVLSVQSPLLNGNDVIIAQNLLLRSPYVTMQLNCSGTFDAATATAVQMFQAGNLITNGVPGSLDVPTATVLLNLHTDDGYVDDGTVPDGYLYKIFIPVHRNRSIETTATLFDSKLNVLHQYTVRTHGQNDPISGLALNQFADDGCTPTGLSEMDLNSPEDDPVSFGPYPVNRFVRGLKGNHAIASGSLTLVSDIRDGLLQHTGEWPDWNATMPMPNSNGCVHGHPEDIDLVWQILTSKLGVQIRQNTNGALPYPYQPQGIVSVQLID